MTKNTVSDKTYKEAFDIALDKKLKEYINKQYDRTIHEYFTVEEFTNISIKTYIAMALTRRLKAYHDNVYSGDINTIENFFEEFIQDEFEDGFPEYDEEYVLSIFYDFADLKYPDNGI